jgi:predicted acetyltransferase
MMTEIDPATIEAVDAPMPDGIVLRRATPETLRTFLSPLASAFGEPWSDQEWKDRGWSYEADRVVAAWDGEEPVACAGAETFRLTVPGGEVAAGGMTLVGVKPTHRRRGILRALIRQQHAEYRARGEALSILWASEASIYQRFGYGLATIQASFDIERTRVAFLRPDPAVGRMRIVGVDEASRLIPPIWEVHRAVTPGALTRNEATWKAGVLFDAPYLQDQGPKSIAVHETDGAPDGYVIYRLKAGWDARGPKSEVYVREVAGLTPAAESAIWRWVLDLDLVAKVTGDKLPNPPTLLLSLVEPRRLGVTLSDGLWVRILDLPAALETRRYAAPGRLVLRVADPDEPDVDGTWVLETHGEPDAGGWLAGRARRVAGAATAVGAATAAAGGADPAETDLEMTVADLGAAYLGGTRFEDLRLAGRIREVRAGAAVRADRMFAPGRTPTCSTMF